MKKKVLIVDDEWLIGETWKMCLELENLEADFVLSVKEAILKINESNYDLIITDLKMPEQGGEILLDYLKNHEIQSKVIVSSGHFENNQLDQQIDKIIPKPFSMEVEIKEIMQLLASG